MKPANQSKQEQNVSSPRMAKLKAVAERAVKLSEGALKERVAVPNPKGGYTMVLRDVKS